MTSNTLNMGAKQNDPSIPVWVRVFLTIFALSMGVIAVRSIAREAGILFGLSTRLISIVSLVLSIAAIGLIVTIWLNPGSSFSKSLYGFIRLFRAQICVFALLGMVLIYVFRPPLVSLRGGLPALNLVLLFCLGWFAEPIRTSEFPSEWVRRFFIQLERMTDRINSLPTLPLQILASILPSLLVCLVIRLAWNAQLSDYMPFSLWNDETSYWVWVRSFSYVRFDAGYNAPNELIAPAGFNHYGEGSPLYTYVYGSIGRIVGWSPQLPLIINFAILGIAIFLFSRLLKLKPVQIIMTSLVTLMVWPVVIFLPMTTHETLNQAIGILLAVLFFRLLREPERVSVPARISFVAAIYIAAIIRLSWGLLLIPVLFYSLNGSLIKRVCISVVVGAGLYLSAMLLTTYLVPPTNNSILSNLSSTADQGPLILVNYVIAQFEIMFQERKPNPNIGVIFQMFVILGWNLVRVVRSVRAKRSIASILESRSVFDVYNVTSLAAAGFLFYMQEGFYRTFTPPLIITYLLMVARRDHKLLITLLLVNLLFLPSYLNYRDELSNLAILRQDFTAKLTTGAPEQSALEDWMRFDPQAKTPWCNTVLIPGYYYDARLTLLPPGIGISYILDGATLRTPLKSKYLLLDSETYRELDGRLNAKLLNSFSIGDLYYNLDSGCE